jgi:hypothetical protein
MSIILKRGTETNRSGLSLQAGELIFTTDTKHVYVGSSTSPTGNEIAFSQLTASFVSASAVSASTVHAESFAADAITGMVRFSSYGAGTLTTDSSGNITATSDARMKDISGSFVRGLDAILNLIPRVYHWSPGFGLNTEDVNVGLIAQEVLPYIPEAVHYKDDRYTMSDRPIIAVLINAVKELKADNDTLRNRVQSLEDRVESLETF